MADQRSDNRPADRAEAAMNRVLQAEREAELTVADSEKQALEILSEARRRANRIANRTDERISLMMMRSSQRVAGEIGKLQRAEKAALEQQIPELDETGVSECIAAISAMLTGGTES